jgi:hypothetical protein
MKDTADDPITSSHLLDCVAPNVGQMGQPKAPEKRQRDYNDNRRLLLSTPLRMMNAQCLGSGASGPHHKCV